MRKFKVSAGIFLTCLFLISCSEPSLEDDAKKAAYLTTQSMEFSLENDLKSAESNFHEVQKIMDKYRDTEDFRKFHDLYDLFLQEYADSMDSAE